VTAVNALTITFCDPVYITFQTLYAATALDAMRNPFSTGPSRGIYFYRQGGDWHGNVPMSLCAYC